MSLPVLSRLSRRRRTVDKGHDKGQMSFMAFDLGLFIAFQLGLVLFLNL